MRLHPIVPVVLSGLLLGGCGDDDRGAGAATAPPETRIEAPIPANAPGDVRAGAQVFAESGCLACHKLDDSGNDGPGPELTDVGDRLSDAEIRTALVEGRPPMPSFEDLGAERISQLVAYLLAER